MTTPEITYPTSAVQTLKVHVAFIAPPHDVAHAQVLGEDTVVWDSGEVETDSCHVPCGTLPSDCPLRARVRVRADGNWSEWSSESPFSVPEGPLVRIVSPVHAGRAVGPEVALRWEVQARSSAAAQRVLMDGTPVSGVASPFEGPQEARARLKGGLHVLDVEVSEGGRTARARSEFWVWNSPQLENELIILDLAELGSWDVAKDPALARRMYEIVHAAACLQGIVNREHPRLMLRLFQQDDEWLSYLREKGNWLERARVVTVKSDGDPELELLDVAKRFQGSVRGLVVWDPAVPATSNVASTAAGVEDLLPVPTGDGEIARRLKEMGFEVKLDLSGMFTGKGTIPGSDLPSTGSPKCDAYLWAKARYLDTGRANARRMGYWLDAFWLKHPGRQSWWEMCLSNHDWIVSSRGFIFDLSNWGDEAPQDDPSQKYGTDLDTFKSVMLSASRAARGEMIHVSGFTPWAFKYTEAAQPAGKHEPVATEWEVVRLLSAYNAYLDADAHGLSAMANGSLWRHMPLPSRYVQNPPPTPDQIRERGYMDENGRLAPLGFTLFYIGDFDSAAWLYRRERDLWADPARGSVPMGWAFNPNLSERMAPAMHHAYTHMSPQDYFTAGDSGAGYVNPTMLQEPRPISGLPSCESAWVDHCRALYRRFNCRITGFLINGHAGKLSSASEKMTAQFSPDGCATQSPWMQGEEHLSDNMPVALQQHDLCADTKASVDCMSRFLEPGKTQFLNFRLILLGPSFVRELTDAARARRPDAPMEMVDPWTFYYLLRKSLGGSNDRRATFTFDTLEVGAQAGEQCTVRVGVRNDGWDTWKAGQTRLVWGMRASVDWGKAQSVELQEDVPPGAGVVISFAATLPARQGQIRFFCDLADARGAFRDSGNPWWEYDVQVRD